MKILEEELRKDIMLLMRNKYGMSLQEIADSFDVSRERVHQVIGNTGWDATRIRKERIHQRMESGGSGIDRPTISGGHARKGADAEKEVSKILLEHGITNCLMPNHYRFDILLENEKSVEVKSSYKHLRESDGSCSGFYSFRANTNHADFLICIIMETKELFIIPSSDCPAKHKIRICWPPKHKTRSKYGKYLNDFDVLNSLTTYRFGGRMLSGLMWKFPSARHMHNQITFWSMGKPSLSG